MLKIINPSPVLVSKSDEVNFDDIKYWANPCGGINERVIYPSKGPSYPPVYEQIALSETETIDVQINYDRLYSADSPLQVFKYGNWPLNMHTISANHIKFLKTLIIKRADNWLVKSEDECVFVNIAIYTGILTEAFVNYRLENEVLSANDFTIYA